MGSCLLGSSSFLHSPLFQSFPPFPTSCCCPALVSPHKKVARGKQSPTAYLRPEYPNGSGNSKRRALLLVGLSAIPFLQLRAIAAAVESPGKVLQDAKVAEAQGPQMQDSRQNDIEHAHAHQAPGNPLVALLSGLGILGSGVLGALYAISQKEKADMELAIESMDTALDEKESSIALLEKDFYGKLLKQQEENKKQVRKLKEDETVLLKQLTSALGTVKALGHELQNEKRLVEGFKLQIDRLHGRLTQAGEDKDMLETKLREKKDAIGAVEDRVSLLTLEINDKEKNIETLTSSLSEKETEFNNLRSVIEQTKVDLLEADSALAHLKSEHLKTKEELNSKNSRIGDLKMKLSSILAERDDIDQKFHDLQKEYNDLKSDFVKKVASDSEALATKDEEIRQLEEKLGLAFTEAKSSQVLITNLTHERDRARATLEEETSNAKVLRDELQITQEALTDSKLEASDLLKQLQESHKMNEELKFEVSRVEAEYNEAQRLLNASLDEARHTSKLLSDEIALIKDGLKTTTDELAAASDDLKATIEARDSLKEELLEANEKAEATDRELKEERKIVAALSTKLEATGKLIKKHAEARKNAQNDLEGATKSLDEKNKKVFLLSRELENANSRSATLQAEKEMLNEALVEQNNVTKEAQEKIEDAQTVITRLGAERERLDTKVKKFEEELGAAKGEILRLRREITSGKGLGGEHHNRAHEKAAVVPKRVGGRRRRAGPAASQTSQSET